MEVDDEKGGSRRIIRRSTHNNVRQIDAVNGHPGQCRVTMLLRYIALASDQDPEV